ncbi:DNA polymerase III chi subunit [Tepidimonas ignava]|uniref:DNA polymerase III chi subunit n=1 Tax=Tepidimonas ignava TaxID=114249 RepID=A0A4R3LIA5_9BURK|nr:DNA polymerase III subunit chi [Tepidimonas ignava]TCS99919.1 DNA polymerase III chi subunit [Tepidimonas ignava]TSE23304.1 DNA polymerase III subunit chi [Tepidimonas ignava]
MTQVAFHLNVPATPQGWRAYVCRLLAKAHAARARVWVAVADADLAALDEALWTLPADDFVPHVRWDAAALLVQRSPIVLAPPTVSPPGPRGVVVNVQPQWLDWLDQGAPPTRVIEIVSTDDEAKAAARQRWRRYQQLGWDPQAYDRAARAGAPAGA